MTTVSKLYLAVLTLVLGVIGLAACTFKAEVTSRPIASKTSSTSAQITLPNRPLSVNDTAITEFCYDGYVYLLNSHGGMTPKIRGADTGDTLATRCEKS